MVCTDFINYITENAIILIPALLIIGRIIKGIGKIPDKFIPLLLLPFGVIGAMALGGWTAEAAVQGILVTGTAVYGNQVYRQMKKDE